MIGTVRTVCRKHRKEHHLTMKILSSTLFTLVLLASTSKCLAHTPAAHKTVIVPGDGVCKYLSR